jgi:hypothetical protein
MCVCVGEQKQTQNRYPRLLLITVTKSQTPANPILHVSDASINALSMPLLGSPTNHGTAGAAGISSSPAGRHDADNPKIHANLLRKRNRNGSTGTCRLVWCMQLYTSSVVQSIVFVLTTDAAASLLRQPIPRSTVLCELSHTPRRNEDTNGSSVRETRDRQLPVQFVADWRSSHGQGSSQ